MFLTLDNVCKQLLHIYLDGTNVTQKSVIDLLLCQRNLEHVESEYLTSALTILANDNSFMQRISSRNANERRRSQNSSNIKEEMENDESNIR